MKTKQFRNSCLLVICAAAWGMAFVAQSSGGKEIGAYSFNCIRMIIGACALLPVIKLLDHLGFSRRPAGEKEKKDLMIGGICCGIILFFASNLQQLGINLGTSPGKAGFITACYILLVPIIGLFLRKKCGWNIWIGVVLTVTGLYLLCMSGSFSLQLSDILVMLCAVCYSLHILTIDHFSPLVDGVRMSCIQFLICGILTLFPMFFIDMKHSAAGILNWIKPFCTISAWIPILYAGIISCGVGYTLQIIGQEDVNPTIASLLMSLESVFSVIASAVILHEYLNTRELVGCVIIFCAIILAQIPVKSQKNV